MNLKDKKYHAEYEKANNEIEINCESLAMMIINVCKTSSDSEVYRRYASISEKIEKGIKEKEYRTLYSNLKEFMDSIKNSENLRNEKMFGFLVLLLLNVNKLTINNVLLEMEKISYCFSILEKTTDSFLGDAVNYNGPEFINALNSFNENLKINVNVNKDSFMSKSLESTVEMMQHNINFIKEVKELSIEYEKEYIKKH